METRESIVNLAPLACMQVARPLLLKLSTLGTGILAEAQDYNVSSDVIKHYLDLGSYTESNPI